MEMKTNTVFILCCISVLAIIAGCGCVSSSSATSAGAPVKNMTTKELAEQQMNLAGVQNAKIVSEGSMVTVSYDPTDVNYEGQIISDWGTILGILLADYPNADQYRIVQMMNGAQVSQITVNAIDAKEYSSGQLTIYQFKQRMQFQGGNGTASS
jgi:hypothetical protein